MSPEFNDLVGTETTGAERERLRRAHELLAQAGAPPELTPQLRKGPSFDVVRRQQRRVVKRRAMLLLAAALSVAAVFAAGFAVGGNRGGSSKAALPAATLALKGTSIATRARGTLEVWHATNGNWPMTLSVVGLPKLPRHTYYEVYLVRNGKPWGSCGAFRVAGISRAVTLTFNAPYSLRKGDSWVVTRPARAGGEPGQTVLRPVSA